MNRNDIIALRRSFRIPGYKTLADVGLDGDYVSPYQIISNSKSGPCIVAYNWLDAPSVQHNQAILAAQGYLPGIPFNKVMDLALAMARLKRSEIYVTQAFHLLPATRSQSINQQDVDASFDQVTKHEVKGRNVIALGDAAARACRRHGVQAIEVCHPSSRTNGTFANRANTIARALRATLVAA